MAGESDSKNLSQTALESAAAWNMRETKHALPASLGVVNDTIFAMHPSGNADISVPLDCSIPSLLFSIFFFYLSLSLSLSLTSQVGLVLNLNAVFFFFFFF